MLLSASADGTARIWDLSTGREKTTAFHPSFVYCASFFANPIGAGAEGKTSGEAELTDTLTDKTGEQDGGMLPGMSSQVIHLCLAMPLTRPGVSHCSRWLPRLVQPR